MPSDNIDRVPKPRFCPADYDPTLPIFDSWEQVPQTLRTRNLWKEKGRKVRPHEKPVAVVRWRKETYTRHVEIHSDGTKTWRKEPKLSERQATLYCADQTVPYRGSRRGYAVRCFREYFVRFSGSRKYLWWLDASQASDDRRAGWQSCDGKLREWQMKSHLLGDAIYGVVGGKNTRFVAIDLDLHEGDPEIFLDQLRVLQGEFHGEDGWHYQVSNESAGGIHLLRVFPQRAMTEVVRQSLRTRLQRLDRMHPDLAKRARRAGMATLGQLEIFPDPSRGFRLPLCRGRTMLLDKPLEMVFDKRRKRSIPDVLGYIEWIMRPNGYMPAEEVVSYLKARLRQPGPQQAPKVKISNVTRTADASNGMSSLGSMKNCFAEKLIAYWTGESTLPDTLNKGIALLARVLPFYLPDPEQAVALIEDYIDELPDQGFSDRLSAGNRSEVSRVIRETVKTVYDANGGQPNPEASSEKLAATVQAWRKRGFDPTDKSTWGKAKSSVQLPLAEDFTWTEAEINQLGQMRELLKTDLETACNLVKYILRLLKAHPGEFSVSMAKKILMSFGIKCGHHGKVNDFLDLLRQWDWIYVRAEAQWHKRGGNGTQRRGRARAWGIGRAMIYKFSGSCSDNDTFKPMLTHDGANVPAQHVPLKTLREEQYLYITSHLLGLPGTEAVQESP